MSTDSPDDAFAVALRGFGPVGLLAIVVILAGLNPLLRGLLVVAWAWRSNTPWSEVGFVRPPSWAKSAAAGLAFGIAFKLIMKAIVMPLLGAPPTNAPYHYLVGNTAALPATVFTMIFVAGFGEETFFRGWMFERLGKLVGDGRRAKVGIVLLTTAVFALAHYPELGWPGAEQAVFTGLAFGAIFAATGRLFVPMVAHAAFDLTAVAMIYWNLEVPMSHLVFR